MQHEEPEVATLEERRLSYHENGIWWIASYPKSGSTWVRLFINAAVTRFPVDINAAFQYASGDQMATQYQAVSCMPIGCMGSREAIYLRPATLINHMARHPNRDCCLKTHHANLYIDEIPLCPAKISRGALYIVRDPRDVVISFSKHIGKDIDETIELMAAENATLKHPEAFFFHYLSSWSGHVKSWLDLEKNPIPTGCIKYEDMLSSPQETFRKIADALGLADRITDDDLEFGLRQTQFENLKQQEERNGFKEKGDKQGEFFNHGRSGRWREILTDDQIRKIEQDHGEMMEILGYELCFPQGEEEIPEILQTGV